MPADGAQKKVRLLIRLRLMNPISNPINSSGLGIKLSVKYTKDGGSGPTTLTRWITGTAGRGSQQAKMVEFGLGAFSGQTVEVTTTWPDGSSQIDTMAVSADSSSTNIKMPVKDVSPLKLLRHEAKGDTVFVEANFIVGTGDDNWWEFKFDGTQQMDPTITLYADTSPYACTCMTSGYQSVVIKPGAPGVKFKVFPIENGVYRHRLMWHAPCCEVGCTFDYKLTGQLGASADSTGTLTCNTAKFCLSGF